MKPLVSFVLPTWNRGHIIQNSILSLINQTEKNFELIIVDDGSEDHTPFIVKQFNDPRIRYFYTQHKGLVHARNYGVDKAQAKIIAHQDSDDLSLPNRLEVMYPLAKLWDVTYHALYENSWNPIWGAINRKFIPSPPLDKDRLLVEQYLPGVCFFKKKVWEKKPFREETQYYYDYSQYIDWAFSGFSFREHNEGLYEYVRTNNSASIEFEKNGKRAESIKILRQIAKKEYNIDINAK